MRMVYSAKNFVVTVATGIRVMTWTEVVHRDVRLVRMESRANIHVVTVTTGICVMARTEVVHPDVSLERMV